MTGFDYDEYSHRLNKVLCKQLFFVGGVLKSGTTWFERLLDAHPDVTCKGEAHFGGSLVGPLSRMLQSYNENVSTKGGAIAHFSEHGGATDVLSYDLDDVSFLAATAIGVMFSKWTAGDDTHCVGDKTPSNLDDMLLLSGLFPTARFFQVIRDGRDSAVSCWYFNLKTDVGKTIEKWGNFEDFCLDYASYWSQLVKNGREHGKSLGSDRYLEIRYESLILNSASEFAKACTFLEIDNSKLTIDNCFELCSFEKLSGGRSVGEEDSQSFYRKGVIGDWKNHFSDELHTEFIAKTDGMLETLGYLA